jgi:hypothetical protein
MRARIRPEHRWPEHHISEIRNLLDSYLFPILDPEFPDAEYDQRLDMIACYINDVLDGAYVVELDTGDDA